jgi:hypothetical protein
MYLKSLSFLLCLVVGTYSSYTVHKLLSSKSNSEAETSSGGVTSIAETSIVEQAARSSRERRFSLMGQTDEEVIRFFKEFQRAVASDDRVGVADMVEFPVCVRCARGDNERSDCRLIGRKAFTGSYDRIFDSDYKRFIADIDPEREGQLGGLWSGGWRGISIDRGQLWIEEVCRDARCVDSKMKITTFSSGFLQRPYETRNHAESP